MGIFTKKSADPRTAKLKKLASAKFATIFAPLAAVIFIFCLGSFIKMTMVYALLFVVLFILAALTNFRNWKKLEKELNAESPITESEKKIIKKEMSKTIIVLIIIFAFAGAMATGNSSSNSTKDQHEEVFSKDPNDWTKEDKAYVDNLFKFIDKHNK